MLWVNVPVVDTIHSKGNKFVLDVKIKTTVDSKLNDISDKLKLLGIQSFN